MTASAIDRMIARRLWNGSTAGPTAGNPNRRMLAIGISDSDTIAYSENRHPLGVALWTIVEY